MPNLTFVDGVKAAKATLLSEPLSDRHILESLKLFIIDPPDTEFQRGYMRVIRKAADAASARIAGE